jgi:NAD-dependent dihydropyrimidine dehydrogenase PreA subunit
LTLKRKNLKIIKGVNLKMSNKKQNKIAEFIRWIILVGVLGFVTYSAYLHQVLGGDKAASIHALCPYGGLESLKYFLQTGDFISKIYTGTMIMFFITIVVAILFRRSFCGVICPFGTLQEIFGRLGKLIFKKNFSMPSVIDKYLRYLKYVVLLVTIVFAWLQASLWMAPYDPWSVYAHLAEGFSAIWEESPIGVIILGLTLAGSIAYDRFFCKYLCPMGAFYGIVGKLSPYKVSRNEDSCINCGLCSKECPVNIDVANLKEVTSSECINCQICVMKCPKEGALENRFMKKIISPLISIILVATLFFVPIWISKASGVFNVTPTAPEEGQVLSIEELKGYMTIEAAMKYSNLSKEEFYELFRIPSSVSQETKLKQISELVDGYSFDRIKHEIEEQSMGDDAKENKLENPYKGKIDPYLVKGSMPIQEAATVVQVSEEEFYKMFLIPDNVPVTTKMKEIVNVVEGYDFEKVKYSLE